MRNVKNIVFASFMLLILSTITYPLPINWVRMRNQFHSEHSIKSSDSKQTKLNKWLFNATCRNNVKEMREAVHAGANPNATLQHNTLGTDVAPLILTYYQSPYLYRDAQDYLKSISNKQTIEIARDFNRLLNGKKAQALNSYEFNTI